MRKLIIPAICLLISFAFSGATTSKKSANSNLPRTSSIWIYNWCSYTIDSVHVEVPSASYSSGRAFSSSPEVFTSVPSGYTRISYYISGTGSGCTRFEGGGACIITEWSGSSAHTYVTTNSNAYFIYLHDVCGIECS
jgi:hypothetical protein